MAKGWLGGLLHGFAAGRVLLCLARGVQVGVRILAQVAHLCLLVCFALDG